AGPGGKPEPGGEFPALPQPRR
ncbi:flagellar protein FhlB, partial [Burkholderia sp. Tr-860]|nr:flagellar protein FhlB [Burkholderia sp. Tr-860]